MKRKFLAALALCAAVAIFAACSNSTEAPKPVEAAKPVAEAAPAPMAPPSAPAHPPMNGPAAAQNVDRGMVTEAMDADGMTYLNVDQGNGKKAWYAAPQAAVNVGEVVALQAPTMKTGYKSAQLNRTFDQIFFVTAVAPMTAQPHPKVAPAAMEVKGVSKLSGGYTVAELYNKKDQLANKDVTLRAKVVKFSGGIMGTNWMHLRDGTGDDKTNDLTITSNATAKAGDTVVVKGKLQKDVDIGSGYFFPVIIRDAEVKAE